MRVVQPPKGCSDNIGVTEKEPAERGALNNKKGASKYSIFNLISNVKYEVVFLSECVWAYFSVVPLAPYAQMLWHKSVAYKINV